MGKEIPKPEPYAKMGKWYIEDRNTAGIQLLKWFLHDGRIRGITKDGEVYEHLICKELTEKFIRGLDFNNLKGCRG